MLPVPGILRFCNYLQNAVATTYIFVLQLSTFLFYNKQIEIPEFLKQEIKDFIDGHYGMPEDERLFPIVQEAVQHKMKRQMEKAGVKKIRVHDLRHSHVALS